MWSPSSHLASPLGGATSRLHAPASSRSFSSVILQSTSRTSLSDKHASTEAPSYRMEREVRRDRHEMPLSEGGVSLEVTTP